MPSVGLYVLNFDNHKYEYLLWFNWMVKYACYKTNQMFQTHLPLMITITLGDAPVHFTSVGSFNGFSSSTVLCCPDMMHLRL